MIAATRHNAVKIMSNTFGLTRSRLFAVRARTNARPRATSGEALPICDGMGIRFVETFE